QRIDSAGAVTDGTVQRRGAAADDWDTIGHIDLLFSHVDQSMTGIDVPKHNFVFGDNLRVILQTAGVKTPGVFFGA
ncbi:MAG: hypothetical protein ACYSU7_16510, partial [Planctomycetota bacterium]